MSSTGSCTLKMLKILNLIQLSSLGIFLHQLLLAKLGQTELQLGIQIIKDTIIKPLLI